MDKKTQKTVPVNKQFHCCLHDNLLPFVYELVWMLELPRLSPTFGIFGFECQWIEQSLPKN